jgi:hypothetical protein
MSVLVVSLLLIVALVAGLLVALVDPKVVRRLLGRLHGGGSRSSPDGTLANRLKDIARAGR